MMIMVMIAVMTIISVMVDVTMMIVVMIKGFYDDYGNNWCCDHGYGDD